MPSLRTEAAKKHPAEWSALPPHAKVLHALAERAGLSVSYTGGDSWCSGWHWVGLDEEFRRCGLFNASTNWAFLGWSSTQTGEGLRVKLLRARDPEHPERWVIIARHQAFAPIGPKSCARFVAMADADAAYQGFRSRVLEPVEKGE